MMEGKIENGFYSTSPSEVGAERGGRYTSNLNTFIKWIHHHLSIQHYKRLNVRQQTHTTVELSKEKTIAATNVKHDDDDDYEESNDPIPIEISHAQKLKNLIHKHKHKHRIYSIEYW